MAHEDDFENADFGTDPVNPIEANSEQGPVNGPTNGPESSEPAPYSASKRPASYWDSDEAFAAVKMEKTVNPHESNASLTRRLFEEAAPQAALTLVHLAQHATNENTRMNAAKYVTERVLGKIGDDTEGTSTPLESLLEEMHQTIENHANGK
jgi:hypothetical protein